MKAQPEAMRTSHPSGTRLLAEFVGTATLVSIVVGSGIMATRLTEDVALQLAINAAATMAGLAVLITTLAPVSGAHFNPVVSVVMWRRHMLEGRALASFIPAQVAGAIVGAILANAMFGEALVAWSTKERSGFGQYLGELIATSGLLAVIIAAQRFALNAATLVPLWIGAAYFFTSSTSFANPAVTLGRMFSDSFAGIAPASAPGFLVSQIIAAVMVMTVFTVRRTLPQE